MPYITENRRKNLDDSINRLVLAIKGNNTDITNVFDKESLTNEEFLDIVGDINYAFSRTVSALMGEVSYGKIAIITGVLENIKQEFYRRVAEKYEDNKILANGDIREYKRLT
jgi:pantothenate kinase type III